MFYQSYLWLFGTTGTNIDEECVLSNEDDNCKVRCLFKIFSGVVDDDIDFERWIGILLFDDGGFEYVFICVKCRVGGL